MYVAGALFCVRDMMSNLDNLGCEGQLCQEAACFAPDEQESRKRLFCFVEVTSARTYTVCQMIILYFILPPFGKPL